MTNPSLGIAMMLTAWACFCVVDTSVKWLVLAGLPALQLAFMRYATQFGLTMLIGARGPRLRLDRRQTGLLLLRGALLASATLMNFIALQYLPLPMAAAILFSSPLLVCVLSIPILGTRIGPWRWFSIVLGFLGVLLVVQPFGDAFHWSALLILYCAFALALFSILTQVLSRDVSAQHMQVTMSGFGTLIFLPFAPMVWTAPAAPSDWALMFGLGVVAWGGHELFARAHSLAEAVVLMPYSYIMLLYMSISSYLIWNDLPQPGTLFGAPLIVISGLIIWWRENRVGIAAPDATGVR